MLDDSFERFKQYLEDHKRMGPLVMAVAIFVILGSAGLIGLNMKYGVEYLIFRDLRDEQVFLQDKYFEVQQNNPDIFNQMHEFFPYLRNYEMLNGVIARIILPVTKDLAHIECNLRSGICLTKRHTPFSRDQYILKFDLNQEPSATNPKCYIKPSPDGDNFFVRVFLKRPLHFCKS